MSQRSWSARSQKVVRNSNAITVKLGKFNWRRFMRVKVIYSGEMVIDVPDEKIKVLRRKWWDNNDEWCFNEALLPLIPGARNVCEVTQADNDKTIYDGGW